MYVTFVHGGMYSCRRPPYRTTALASDNILYCIRKSKLYPLWSRDSLQEWKERLKIEPHPNGHPCLFFGQLLSYFDAAQNESTRVGRDGRGAARFSGGDEGHREGREGKRCQEWTGEWRRQVNGPAATVLPPVGSMRNRRMVQMALGLARSRTGRVKVEQDLACC
uniref:Uncharacterized protein n=1 Tax=Anopheles atroparvus TaxID=41427 RepID=A0A182JLV3_ANOAO